MRVKGGRDGGGVGGGVMTVGTGGEGGKERSRRAYLCVCGTPPRLYPLCVSILFLNTDAGNTFLTYRARHVEGMRLGRRFNVEAVRGRGIVRFH